jgi:NADH-quinone oxidoreductase subunit H
MDTSTLLISTAVKILIVVGIAVAVFAPMLVWAERRQSAMIQDRVGPHRANILLPAPLVDGMRALMPLLGFAALASFLVFLASVFTPTQQLFGLEPSLAPADGGDAPRSPTFWAGLATVLFAVGYAVHKFVADSKGDIRLLGLLHPLADALKFIFKEDFIPPKADKFLHAMAPIVTLMPALAIFAVIPFADTVYLDHLGDTISRTGAVGGTAIPMTIAPLDVGILFVFAVAGTGIIGAAVGGYASDNKYSLMGGLRAASQMVSYEVTLGLALVPAFMIFGSLRLDTIAEHQHHNYWGIVYPPMWFAFILFFTAAVAETKRIPFDLPEGESELVGGYLTEYSGFKFGMFFMAEFIEVVGLSAICAVLFFGGWDVPFLFRDGWDFSAIWPFAQTEYGIPGTNYAISSVIPMAHWGVTLVQVLVFFFVKVLGLIWFQLMVRWTLPRFRYDQVMKLCWKGLLPAALANILFTGAFVLLFLL